MPEGYCVKCKAKKEIVEAVEEVMKNGRKAIKGRCPTCGVVMFKILGGKAVVPPPAPALTEPVAGLPSPASNLMPLPAPEPGQHPAPEATPNPSTP